MEKNKKMELAKLIMSKTLICFGIYGGTLLLCASIKNCSKEKNESNEQIINDNAIYCNDENYETNRYFTNAVKIIKEDGTIVYIAPSGWLLAYDDDGKPYCYQDRIENSYSDSEAITLTRKLH